MAAASSPNRGKAYSAPSTRGEAPITAAERDTGTDRPSTAMSWLPVAHSPDTVQVSTISTSSRGNSTSRGSTGRPSSSVRQPPISQSQNGLPLANAQRPVTSSRSPAPTA